MSCLAFLNTFLCYGAPGYIKNTHPLAKNHDNQLISRLFGTWTLISAGIRMYAAFHIESQAAQIAVLITLLAAVWHWGSEWLIFKTTDWERVRYGLLLDAAVAGYMVWRMV